MADQVESELDKVVNQEKPSDPNTVQKNEEQK